MNLPSIKTIERAFPGKGRELRALLDGSRKTRNYASVQQLERDCYHAPGHQYRLETALNEAAGTYRAEDICSHQHDPHASYLNTGDTYTATLLFDYERGRWYVTSCGDWLESAERRGFTFD